MKKQLITLLATVTIASAAIGGVCVYKSVASENVSPTQTVVSDGEWTINGLEKTPVYGEKFSLPEATVKIDGEDVSAEVYVCLPSGRNVSDDEILISETGNYKAVFSVERNGKLYKTERSFSVNAPFISAGAKSSFEYGTYTEYGCESGNTGYYNQLINWQQFLNGGELSVFYYSAHYDNYFVPLDSVTNMGQKYKFFADNGVKHLYNMGQSGDDVYTDWYALKTYMESKYTQDAARTDADELILNFCKAYYGAAGDIMYELYKAEVAQYKVASNYWINQKGADPTGGHLIRKYLFDENCWGGNADLLLGWYEKIENALAAVDSNSAYYNRIKIEGLNIRYLLAGIFNNTSKGTMAEISADAKNLGIDIFAEGNAYTSNGEYGQSGKIEDLK